MADEADGRWVAVVYIAGFSLSALLFALAAMGMFFVDWGQGALFMLYAGGILFTLTGLAAMMGYYLGGRPGGPPGGPPHDAEDPP